MSRFHSLAWKLAWPVVWPVVRALDPETAHGLAIAALGLGRRLGLGHHLGAGQTGEDDPILNTRVLGLDFANPIGLAAGFDKDARVPGPVLGLGFGFTEVGSVTPLPQAGNPRPRLFRLTADRAVINRMGFNNLGLEAMSRRLEVFRQSEMGGRHGLALVGVNLGRNKDSPDAIADYVAGVAAMAGLADYLVVNVSSPNTPGLRALQGRGPLTELLGAVMEARENSGHRPPLLLKVAPDLTGEDKEDIAQVALAAGVDGLIATNTTIQRPNGLADPQRSEQGGLSGRPLFDLSTGVLADLYRLTGGRLPLIGVGGVASGAHAYAKIRAGASLVQLYSSLIYEGPGQVGRIKEELTALLRAGGFSSLSDAVGADHR